MPQLGRTFDVPKKPAKPASRQPVRARSKPAEVRVALTIHVSGEAFDILGDAALAREIDNVAKASHGQKVKWQDRNQSIAAVIEGLIERNLTELEIEGEMIRGSRLRRRTAARKRRQKAKKGSERPQAPAKKKKSNGGKKGSPNF